MEYKLHVTTSTESCATCWRPARWSVGIRIDAPSGCMLLSVENLWQCDECTETPETLVEIIKMIKPKIHDAISGAGVPVGDPKYDPHHWRLLWVEIPTNYEAEPLTRKN